MKSSVDYSQTYSAGGYEQAQYDAEYLGGKKYKADVIIDSRWRNQGLDGAFNLVADSDPVIFLSDRDNLFLCRRFAQLERKEKQADDIINFANQYGFLGLPAIQTFGGHPSVLDTGIVNPFPGRSNFVYAERTDVWCDEIREMNEVLERFELVLRVRQDDLEGYQKIKARERLKKLFYGGSVVYAGNSRTLIDSGDMERIKKNFSHPDIHKYCDEGDIESAELAYVGLRISRQLHKHTSLTLAWNLDDKSSRLQFRTISLIGALWLQLSEYVTQARRLNFCRMCGDTIPIVGSDRSDKDLCGKRCSKRASRAGRTLRKRKKPESEV